MLVFSVFIYRYSVSFDIPDTDVSFGIGIVMFIMTQPVIMRWRLLGILYIIS